MCARILLPLALIAAGCTTPAGLRSSPIPPLSVELHDLRGRPYQVGDHLAKGSTVALVFWQSWSDGCAEAAPELARAARERGDSMRFFGVVPGPDSVVDPDDVRRTAAQWGFEFPTLRDRDLAVTNLLGVTGTPTLVVLDPSGRIRYRGRSVPPEWNSPAATASR